MANDYDVMYYPYYGMLSDREKTVYQRLLPEIRKGQKEIALTVSAGSQEVFRASAAIFRDHPEIFWTDGGCQVLTRNGMVVTVKPAYNRLLADFKKRQALLDKAVKSYTGAVSKMKPLEQERYIHDRMVREISYVSGEFDQTAYAALVDKRAVCTGYSRAFQLLMQALGIPCYLVNGQAYGKTGAAWEPHSWNIVRLDGDYYNMDITWDDCYDSSNADRIGYSYYNCTDKYMESNHRRDPDCAGLPVCRGTKYSFEKVNGASPELELIYQDGVTIKTPVSSKADFVRMAEGVLKKNRSKTVKFSFPANNSKVCSEVLEWFKEVVVKAYPRSGFSMNSSTTDYRNGWYRIELTLTLQ